MNIQIANRLVSLRKKCGLSQEELANRLGISRQAVSKWERAESSPDTDNLICLAKLYGVSLDEILNCDEDIEQIIEENKKDEKEKENDETVYKKGDSTVKIVDGVIYVEDDDDKIVVEPGKIHVKSKNRNVTMGRGDNTSFKFDWDEVEGVKVVTKSLYVILVIVAYIALGFCINGMWAFGWVFFLTIPVYYSIIKAIKKRSIRKFNFFFFVLFVYLGLGMATTIYPEIFNFTWWHPGWLILLAIPVWNELMKIVDTRFNPIIIDDDDEDNDDEKDE